MTTLNTTKKPSIWTTAYTIIRKSMIVIITSLLLFTAMLISTQTGLQIITSYISSSIPIQFENVQGRLITGFQIEKVTLPNSITIKQVKGKWIKGSLIELQLHADQLNIDTRKIQNTLNIDIPTNILEKIPQTLIEKIEIALQLTPYQKPVLQAKWSLDKTHYQLNSQFNNHTISGSLLSHQSEDQHANLTFHCEDYSNNPLINIHGQLWVDSNLLTIQVEKNQETEGDRGSVHVQHIKSQFHLYWHTHEQNHIIKAKLETEKHQAKLNMLHGKNIEYNLDFLSKEVKLGPLNLRDMNVKYQSSNQNNALEEKVSFTCKKAQYEQFMTQNLKVQYMSDKDAQQLNKNDSQITAEVLRYKDTTIGRNLHLTSKGLDQKQNIQVILDQKQGPLEADINIEKIHKEWKVLINKLVLAKNYLLISPDNPKKILFEPDHLIITSKHTSNKAVPLDMNLKYFYNHDMDAQITATSFPLNRLPKELLEVFIVPFDNLEGNINGNLQIKTQPQHEIPKLEGNLAIYIEQAKIRSILQEIPLNSSLNIKKAKLEGTLSDQGLQLKGQGQVNQGRCEVDISAPWSNTQESGISLLVNGKNILFKQSANSHIQLDSQLHILHQSGRTHTEGDIYIHDSIYRSNTWDMSTQLPPETIVVSKNTPEASNKSVPTYAIKLHMRENNQIHAFGFHGELHGDLLMKGLENDSNRCDGNIHMEKGHILLFKKSLPLSRCVFSWFETPINSPNINLEILQKEFSLQSDSRIEQGYGMRVSGPINQLEFEFFSHPKKMTEPEILSALLVQKQAALSTDTESMDNLLADLNHSQFGGSDLASIFSLLTTLRQMLFFDQVDINNYDSSNDNDSNNPNPLFDDLEITLTKLINDYFTVRVRFASNEKRSSKVSFDAQLNDRMTLSSYMQNEGITGLEFYYSHSQ